MNPWTPNPAARPTPLGSLRMAVDDYLAHLEDNGIEITDEMLAVADSSIDQLVDELSQLSAA